MSDDSYQAARAQIRKGVLGKVVLAQIDYSRNQLDDFWAYPIDPDARPGDNLDWNAWLGPAPKRPFDGERFGRWRRYWEYSGGIASDLFVHRITRFMKALDLTFPDYVVSTGGKFEFAKSIAEIPDTFNVLLDYPGGLTVQLISPMANDIKVIISSAATDPRVHRHRVHHYSAEAVRHNEPLKCDYMLGYYGVVACEMSVVSYRKRRYLPRPKLVSQPEYAPGYTTRHTLPERILENIRAVTPIPRSWTRCHAVRVTRSTFLARDLMIRPQPADPSQ